MIKIKKKIPLIDQHDKFGFWGGKFGGYFIPETLKKPIEDLTKNFEKLRKNNNFINKRDFYFKKLCRFSKSDLLNYKIYQII